jgi:hypothetical protein
MPTTEMRPQVSSRPCPSCGPGLPLCVSCYLDMRDLERMEDDAMLVMEGYEDR